MDKVFAVAGVSTLEGVVKARFAKDLARVKVLEKNGHTAIRLVELPNEMTKDAALSWLRGHKDFQDAAAQAALVPEDTAAAKPVKAAKPSSEPKAKAEPKAKPEKAVAKAAAPKAKTEPKVTSDVEAIRAKNREAMKAAFDKFKEQQVEATEGTDAAATDHMPGVLK